MGRWHVFPDPPPTHQLHTLQPDHEPVAEDAEFIGIRGGAALAQLSNIRAKMVYYVQGTKIVKEYLCNFVHYVTKNIATRNEPIRFIQ